MSEELTEMYGAMKDDRKERRARFGVDCPKCKVWRPKTNPSKLLPGQTCRVDGYVDPRDPLDPQYRMPGDIVT